MAGDRNVNAGVYFLNETSSLRMPFNTESCKKWQAFEVMPLAAKHCCEAMCKRALRKFFEENDWSVFLFSVPRLNIFLCDMGWSKRGEITPHLSPQILKKWLQRTIKKTNSKSNLHGADAKCALIRCFATSFCRKRPSLSKTNKNKVFQIVILIVGFLVKC